MGGELTLFFIDSLQLSLPVSKAAREPLAIYATRVKGLEHEDWALLPLYEAQQKRKVALEPGRVDTTFQVGDLVMMWTKGRQASPAVGGPLFRVGARRP